MRCNESSMSERLRLWLTVAIVALLVIFTFQNLVTVEVTFLFWAIQMPRAILVFVVFVIGALLGWIIGSARRHRRRSK